MKDITTKLVQYATLKGKRICLVQFFLLLLLGNALAQISNDRFKKLPEELGLSNTPITAIVQDQKGYLWFGTWVGLYRYDGYNARLYKVSPGFENGLKSNKISTLFIDRKGNLLVGTLLGGAFRYNYESDHFVQIEMEGNQALRTNIWSFYEDKNEQLWVGTERGIGILDPATKTIKNKDIFLKSEINGRRIQKISDCGSDFIWVATDDGVFAYLAEENGKISQLGKFNFNIKGASGEVSDFVSDMIAEPGNPEKLWILCKTGIATLDFSRGFTNTPIKSIQATGSNLIFPRCIAKTSSFDGKLLLGTGNGLRLMDTDGALFPVHLLHAKIIRTLFEDGFGTIWLGTENGLYRYNPNESFVNFVSLSNESDDLQMVEFITRSPSSNQLWLGWQNGTLTNLNSGDFDIIGHHSLSYKGNIVKDRISHLCIQNNGVSWIATQGSGLLKTNEKSLQSAQIVQAERVEEELIEPYLMSLMCYKDELLIGTWNTGLIQYNPITREVKKYTRVRGLGFDLLGIPVVALSHYENIIILGTRGAGVIVAKLEKNGALVLIRHLRAQGDGNIASDFITSITLDKSRILICSEGGLNAYDINTSETIDYHLDQHLPKAIIQALVIDDDGKYWVSSYNNGIVEISHHKNKIEYKNYTKGVLSNISSNAGWLLEEGKVLFGGAHGLALLDLKDRITNNKAPIPFFTDLKINNKHVGIRDTFNGAVKLSKDINELPEIDLSYKDNAFSITINAMHTSEAQSVKYAYQLEGFNKDWVYMDENEKQISFTNLPYRSYQLHFKAANSDGVWSEVRSLPINISPPWWQSLPAYFVYFCCICGIIFLIVQGFIMKEQYAHQMHLEKLERTKIEEINQMKLKFYTSISHELRTPLTMIITPTEQLLRDNNLEEDYKQTHRFILKNARKLLNMVNQLLDFRKHETEELSLHLRKIDLLKHIEVIADAFKSITTSKNISLQVIKNVASIPMAFDEEQMERLLNNLISNAIKYTPKGGRISITVLKHDAKDEVQIIVRDNGKGIPRQDLGKIFERFYQGNNHEDTGYGLGLAIAKSIVDMHKGRMWAESEEGQGAVFNVVLPTNLHAQASVHELEHIQLFEADDAEETRPSNNVKEKEEHDIKTMLVVEDNDEIRSYIKQNFIRDFRILEASNGANAYKLCQEYIPDIVISDIAMPEMDGLELTKLIKSNIATSHIAIILLTARTSVEFKLSGYESGANAYVTKPFNMDILKQQVNNLMEYSQLLKDKYRGNSNKLQYTYEPEKPQAQSLDEEFMASLSTIIEEHISEAEFTVDDMAKLLLMSRIQVYRKIKALTGQTPNNFLREIRLKRAAQLLELTDYSVQEVTYKVGFNDLKYFREKFKDEFGVNPSEYRQQHKNISQN